MDLIERNSWNNPEIDEEAGIIRNVKVLGNESRNNRTYPKALRDSINESFNGIKVNINHGTDGKSVPLEARFGVLKNPRSEADGTYADLHYLKSHPMANSIKEAAQVMPDVLGMSISAKGKVKKVDGKDVVESCVLQSVDIVSDPATVSSLFESEQSPEKLAVIAILDEGLEPLTTAKKIAEVYAKYQPLVEVVNPELEALKTEKATRQLCESMKFQTDSHLFNVLTQLDEATRKEHVKFLKRKDTSSEIISNQNINTKPVEIDWLERLRK